MAAECSECGRAAKHDPDCLVLRSRQEAEDMAESFGLLQGVKPEIVRMLAAAWLSGYDAGQEESE